MRRSSSLGQCGINFSRRVLDCGKSIWKWEMESDLAHRKVKSEVY